MSNYDLWKQESGNPYLQEEKNCSCEYSNKACRVHDPEFYDEDGNELKVARVLGPDEGS